MIDFVQDFILVCLELFTVSNHNCIYYEAFRFSNIKIETGIPNLRR